MALIFIKKVHLHPLLHFQKNYFLKNLTNFQFNLDYLILYFYKYLYLILTLYNPINLIEYLKY